MSSIAGSAGLGRADIHEVGVRVVGRRLAHRAQWIAGRKFTVADATRSPRGRWSPAKPVRSAIGCQLLVEGARPDNRALFVCLVFVRGGPSTPTKDSVLHPQVSLIVGLFLVVGHPVPCRRHLKQVLAGLRILRRLGLEAGFLGPVAVLARDILDQRRHGAPRAMLQHAGDPRHRRAGGGVTERFRCGANERQKALSSPPPPLVFLIIYLGRPTADVWTMASALISISCRRCRG